MSADSSAIATFSAVIDRRYRAKAYMKMVVAILMAGVALFVFQASRVQAQNSAQSDNAEKGKAVFMRVGCYACHGTVGQGGTGPRLAPNPMTTDRLTAYVRKPAGMPAYSAKVLSDSDLADIRAYLATIPAPPPVNSIPLLNQ
jgi:ubiquinol-cytochrome c reductase cytochrome c subunit